MEKKICLIIASNKDDQLNRVLNNYTFLIDHLINNFGDIDVVDLSFFLLKKNQKPNIKNQVLQKKINYFFFKKKIEVYKFFRGKNYICINNLGFGFNYFYIWFLLNFCKVKIVNIQNDQLRMLNEQKKFKKNKFLFINNLYVYRLLVLLRVFPKIDVLFTSSNEIVYNIKNGLSYKIDNLINYKFFSLVKKFYLINIKFYEHKLKLDQNKNAIVFIDTAPFDHPALTSFSKEKILTENREKYYKNLRLLLKKLSDLTQKKILICLHPKYNLKYIKQDFLDIECLMYKTYESVIEADTVIFSSSSMITLAMILDKKIIQINSKYFPNYFKSEINHWKNIFNFVDLNIDKELSDDNLIKILSESDLNTKNYHKIKKLMIHDKTVSPSSQIVNVLKKI